MTNDLAGIAAPDPRAVARVNNFDFLRFALATIVILTHSWDLLYGSESNPVLLATRGQTELGSIAVDGFFVLSGFLISMSFLNSRSTGDYLRRRVLRIYPGYLATALVSLLFFAPLGMRFSRDYWNWVEPWTFLRHLPFLQPLWVPPTFQGNHWPYVNSPIWTIQHEFVCYLLVIALGMLGVLRKRWLLLAFFLPIYLFHQIQMPWKVYLYDWRDLPIGGAPDSYPRLWTYFLAGALALAFRDRIALNWKGLVLSVSAIVVAGASGYGLDAVMPFALSYILLWLAFSPALRLHNWARHGDLSYGLYLYGWPVQQSIILLMKPWISALPLFAIAMPITLAFATCSWRFVERPFLQLKARRRQEAESRLAEPSTSPA